MVFIVKKWNNYKARHTSLLHIFVCFFGLDGVNKHSYRFDVATKQKHHNNFFCQNYFVNKKKGCARSGRS